MTLFSLLNCNIYITLRWIYHITYSLQLVGINSMTLFNTPSFTSSCSGSCYISTLFSCPINCQHTRNSLLSLPSSRVSSCLHDAVPHPTIPPGTCHNRNGRYSPHSITFMCRMSSHTLHTENGQVPSAD